MNIKTMPRVRQGIKVMPPRWWNGKTGSPFLTTSLSSPAAAAAKSLQSCPALSDPMDCSLPGSSVHGIFQARVLECVAISFSNAWKWKVKVKSLSCVRLFTTQWTAAHQAPPSMGFSRQEYWSGVPLPSPLSSARPPIFRLFFKLNKIHAGKPLLVEVQLKAFLTDRAAMKTYGNCAAMRYMSNVSVCSKMFTFISPFQLQKSKNFMFTSLMDFLNIAFHLLWNGLCACSYKEVSTKLVLLCAYSLQSSVKRKPWKLFFSEFPQAKPPGKLAYFIQNTTHIHQIT